MNKITTFSIVIFNLFTSSAFAQVYESPTNGNVGIGTTTPYAKLHVIQGEQNSNGNAFIISTGTGSELRMGINIGYSWIQSHASKPLYINELGNNVILNNGGGNVGLGTTSPAEKLDINGNVKWNGYRAGNARALNIGYSGGNYGGIGYNVDYTTTTGVFNRPLADQSSFLEFTYGGFKFYGNANGNSANSINLNGGDNNLNLYAIITRTGDFGIGTATPDEKLSVNGKIHTQEVRVDMNNWPDYVFKPDYKLPTLSEIEKQIKQNGHLPGMPSAEKIEANGLAVGEMLKLQQQKIEELTLFMIEREKEVKNLQQQNKQLTEKMNLIIQKLK